MTACPNCGGQLKELNRERILPDPDYSEMSDDELIEFFGEDITGNYEKWGEDQIHFRCLDCGNEYKMKHGAF